MTENMKEQCAGAPLVWDEVKLQEDTHRITNRHRAFRNTPFAERSWWIDIRWISAAHLERIIRKQHADGQLERGVNKADLPMNSELNTQVFAEAVVAWDIRGSDGEVLPCTLENRLKVGASFFNLTHRVVTIATNRDTEMLSIEEEEGNV